MNRQQFLSLIPLATGGLLLGGRAFRDTVNAQVMDNSLNSQILNKLDNIESLLGGSGGGSNPLHGGIFKALVTYSQVANSCSGDDVSIIINTDGTSLRLNGPYYNTDIFNNFCDFASIQQSSGSDQWKAFCK